MNREKHARKWKLNFWKDEVGPSIILKEDEFEIELVGDEYSFKPLQMKNQNKKKWAWCGAFKQKNPDQPYAKFPIPASTEPLEKQWDSVAENIATYLKLPTPSDYRYLEADLFISTQPSEIVRVRLCAVPFGASSYSRFVIVLHQTGPSPRQSGWGHGDPQ